MSKSVFERAGGETSTRILNYICEYQLVSSKELGHIRPVAPKLSGIARDLNIPLATVWFKLKALSEEGYLVYTDENYCEILRLPELPASKKNDKTKTNIKTSKKHTTTS